MIKVFNLHAKCALVPLRHIETFPIRAVRAHDCMSASSSVLAPSSDALGSFVKLWILSASSSTSCALTRRHRHLEVLPACPKMHTETKCIIDK